MLKRGMALGILSMMLVLGGCQTGEDAITENEENVSLPQGDALYPSEPIRLIIPFAAGGGTDSIGRALALASGDYFEYPIIPINTLGDSGARGLKEGLNAKADGYTVTVVTSEINSLPAVGLADLSYQDMVPLMLLNSEPGLVVASKSFPYDSIEEMIEAYKAEPQVHTIGSAGEGSIWHLAAVGVSESSGMTFESRFYNGTSLAVLDVLGGKLDMVIAGTSEVIHHIEAGEIKVLTVLADQRLEVLPEVKTFRESGYDFSIQTWRGLALPAGTPDEIRDLLTDGFAKAAKDDAFISVLEELNLHYDYRDAEAFKAFLLEDYQMYERLVD